MLREQLLLTPDKLCLFKNSYVCRRFSSLVNENYLAYFRNNTSILYSIENNRENAIQSKFKKFYTENHKLQQIISKVFLYYVQYTVLILYCTCTYVCHTLDILFLYHLILVYAK